MKPRFVTHFFCTHLTASLILLLLFFGAGCKSWSSRPGTFESRRGDEIVVAGQLVHTGTRVVLWMDPGGYDAYRVERRFSPYDRSDWKHSQEDEPRYLRSPNRYGMRLKGLSDVEIERVRGGGWDLPTLQKVVDQFVIHFDVAGVSQQCFRTLQDKRDLSVQFMLDIDGTIYQTLDLKERAWQATIANDRSVGVEIANMGSWEQTNKDYPLDKWYHRDAQGRVSITLPPALGDGGVRTRGFVGHPKRQELIHGNIQGLDLVQYDFTPEQYRALVKLTATLCAVFPKIQCKYPTDASGRLITHKLAREDFDNYEGILGHYHIQTEKVDPGPAFDWDYVIGGAKRILAERPQTK